MTTGSKGAEGDNGAGTIGRFSSLRYRLEIASTESEIGAMLEDVARNPDLPTFLISFRKHTPFGERRIIRSDSIIGRASGGANSSPAYLGCTPMQTA